MMGLRDSITARGIFHILFPLTRFAQFIASPHILAARWAAI
jgi:hypothetical protein